MDTNSDASYPLNSNFGNDFQSAENRLQASREALRRRLQTSENQNEDDRSQQNPGPSTHAENSINSWSSLLMSLVSPSARKVATRHPYALIAGSAVVGAYLAWARPWRGVLGSVLVGALARSLISASVTAGSRSGGRILRHYLNRTPQKKYPAYEKQEHASASSL